MRKTFYSILEEVEKTRGRKKKIEKLHEHSSAALKSILGYAFDPNVKWLLPEGEVPYKALPANADVEGQFMAEIRKLYLFVDGPTDTQKNLKQIRREQLFIQMLESIDYRDAELLCNMKDRKLPFKSITPDLVAEAFPLLAKKWET